MNETLALLLTDIVDSTRLNDELGDEVMAALWQAHDTGARELIRAWRGREVGRSDGFLVLFDSARDAISFAQAYHRWLAGLSVPLSARVGIHVGSVRLRENSEDDIRQGATRFEIDGVALPTAARVMSVAQGAQTLVTASMREAIEFTSLQVKAHGHWRFKGLSEPVPLLQVGEDSSLFRPPLESPKGYSVVWRQGAWIPTGQVTHNLTSERDAFVGRRKELAAIERRFADGARLVTVLGIGGCGKTRLTLRFALEALAEYPDGVWFCDLSQARSAEGVLFAVAQGLGLTLAQGNPVVQIAQAIAGRGHCLVILDNFEQVAREAEGTLGHWLDRAPDARYLVTSREVLGIPGEEVLPLAPMHVDDGIELFIQRARNASMGYSPTPEDIHAIRSIVTMLDALPLALELTAARVRTLPPHKLLDRVRDRIDLTLASTGRRDRQATMQATFDWSWDLLTEDEKSALASLSIFEGGFTLDSAAAIVELRAAPGPGDVLDVVQHLVDKSLVRRVAEERYDLLETVREFASRRLGLEGSFQHSGPRFAAAARARHWRYFGALSESQATASRCVEVNNLVAACRSAATAGEGHQAARCLQLTWAALRIMGPYQAAVNLAQLVADIQSIGDADLACVGWVAGDALDLMGQVEASRIHLNSGLSSARSSGAIEFLIRLLVVQSNRQMLDGDFDAAWAGLQEAGRLAASHDLAPLQMVVLNDLGRHMDHQARWTEAKAYYEQALQLAHRLKDRRVEGGLLGNLGGLLHDQGDLQQARTHYETALSLAIELGDRRWEGNGHCNLGLLYQDLGLVAEARGQFERALSIAREVGHAQLEYIVLCNLGALLTSEGKFDDAHRHLQQALDAANASGDKRREGQFRGFIALNHARKGDMREARAALEIGEELLVAMADSLSHALLLCDRAEVEVLARRPSDARRAFERAQRMADELKCGDESELRRRLQRLALRIGAGA